jgi:7-keto-8-aminopelargonate synthetase-like enzyme
MNFYQLSSHASRRDRPVMPTESYIVPVFMGDPQRCKAICDELLVGFGIYVQPINYPTVPRGTSVCVSLRPRCIPMSKLIG